MMYTIICVDHDLSSLNFYENVLGDQAHTIQTCTSGIKAMELIESNAVDLIILDIALADISVNSLCAVVRREGKNKQACILITGEDNDRDAIIAAISEGADDYFVKPLSEKELKTKISVLFAKHKRASEKPETMDELYAGCYQIIRKIGAGAHSKVYEAKNHSHESSRHVALKIFDLQAYRRWDSTFNPFFLREAYGMSKLAHPNIVRLLDFGRFRNSYFLAMELIEGDSLKEVVSVEGGLEEIQLKEICFRMASVLAYLEDHSVVHRDIKPANIMISKNGEIKLTDFGLAKQKDDLTLTRANAHFSGTPNFVAPELILDEKDVDIRCDVYSLGATLFYCGTNTLPFTGKTVVDTLNNNLNDVPPLMGEINAKISSEFSQLILCMMEKNKEKRPTPKALTQILLTKFGMLASADV